MAKKKSAEKAVAEEQIWFRGRVRFNSIAFLVGYYPSQFDAKNACLQLLLGVNFTTRGRIELDLEVVEVKQPKIECTFFTDEEPWKGGK